MPKPSNAQQRLRNQLESGARAQPARERLKNSGYRCAGALDDPATGAEIEVWQHLYTGAVRLLFFHRGGWDVYRPCSDSNDVQATLTNGMLSITLPKSPEAKPKKTPADAAEIELMLDDLVRVDPFHRHSNWLPHEIVEAEAAKRPRGPRSPHMPGPGTGTERPEDEKNPVPTIRSGTTPPPP